MLLAVMLLGRAWAAVGVPTDSGIESCARIADDHQRLACFDREVSLMKAQRHTADQAASATAASTPAAGATPSVTTPAATPSAATTAAGVAAGQAAPRAELTPEQRMGLTPGRVLQLQSTANKSPDLKELSVKIQAASTNSAGRGVFRLENGQVWQEVEPDAKFTVQPGQTVLITRGAMGSYFMSASAHMSTRVTRWQ